MFSAAAAVADIIGVLMVLLFIVFLLWLLLRAHEEGYGESAVCYVMILVPSRAFQGC